MNETIDDLQERLERKTRIIAQQQGQYAALVQKLQSALCQERETLRRETALRKKLEARVRKARQQRDYAQAQT